MFKPKKKEKTSYVQNPVSTDSSYQKNDSSFPDEKAFLDIRNLTVEYTSDKTIVHAVNNISLKLNRGKTLGLVGETGAGKTTIAKAIMKILPERQGKIRQGSIWFDGKELNQIGEKEMQTIRGNKISMIFQDPMSALNPTMRVGEQIAEAIFLHEEIKKKDAEERAAQMMEMVGISRTRYRDYPHQFSGGMKQRIVIAIALACQPELLLADEPTTALDVTIQAQVIEMIQKLKEELNTSMIMITHDLGIVAGTCDYVAVIYAGEVIEYGSAEEIFDHPKHPYTLGLFGSLPSMNNSEKRLHPINGMMPDPTSLPNGCKFNPRCPYASEECKSCVCKKILLSDTHYVTCQRKDVISK